MELCFWFSLFLGEIINVEWMAFYLVFNTLKSSKLQQSFWFSVKGHEKAAYNEDVVDVEKFEGQIRLPAISWRKVGMTSSLHGPYELGYTRATMVITKGSKKVTWSKSPKIISVRIGG